MIISNELRKKINLPLVLGLCDGIITVLIFIVNRLMNSHEVITVNYAFRFSMAASLNTIFVFFVSEYSELRRQLLHYEHELNLQKNGQLAITSLGKKIIFESFLGAAISGLAAFLGALIPIMVAIMMQTHKWASILSAVMSLGILGIFLAKLAYGNKIRWALTLIAAGSIISYIGILLNIA